MKSRRKSDERTRPTPIKGDCGSGNCSGAAEVVEKRLRDGLLVTKDYYDEYGSSDDFSSNDESVDDDIPGTNAVSMHSNDQQTARTEKADERGGKIVTDRKVDPRTGEEDIQLSCSFEANECRENVLISRVERVFGSGESDLKKNIHETNSVIEDGENDDKCSSVDVMMKNGELLSRRSFGDQYVKKSVDTCSKSCLLGNEKTSRVLSTKGSHALKIIPDPAEDDEFSSAVSETPSSDKVEDISIRLPWTPPCVEEECHIKRSFV